MEMMSQVRPTEKITLNYSLSKKQNGSYQTHAFCKIHLTFFHMWCKSSIYKIKTKCTSTTAVCPVNIRNASIVLASYFDTQVISQD